MPGPGSDTFFVVFYLIAALIGTVFIAILFHLVWRTVSNLRAAKEHWSAKVVTKRHQVSGGSEGSRTAYFVTFETPEGKRREFAVKGKHYGYLVEGDQGIVHTQGTWFLQFDRQR